MKKKASIDLVKLAVYLLKRCWLLILCGLIGFGFMYWRTSTRPDTYTASGTMYVNNGNPNSVNYQYTNATDLDSAVQLMNTYMVVVRSEKVMNAVAERLIMEYPLLTPQYISATLSMGSVSETGVMRVSCTTDDPQKSADICNAVLYVAPAEIIRVVSAGNIEIIDYATAPLLPNARSYLRSGAVGFLLGAFAAAALLVILFLLNQKVESGGELTDNYTPPVLAEIRRDKREEKDPGKFLLNSRSDMDVIESYAKLRMNLFYTLVGKESRAVMVTSAISGEGKSTVAANLAISCAAAERRVLLIDADMRRACQGSVFHSSGRDQNGLSDVLVGNCAWKEVIVPLKQYSLDLMPAGHLPPNPAEMLESDSMRRLLEKLAKEYDLILLDSPPINIVSDPMALSSMVAGALFVVRQGFSDHREIRKALITAEMTGMNVLGFVFYGEKLRHGKYYNRHYQGYYQKYDARGKAANRQSMPERRTEADEKTANPLGMVFGPAAADERGGKRKHGK